ncbi:histidine--tRNA ligase [Aureitalea marina]|uniref:Histidine--tRNA ligase n=1 Tax=Aureitalea marina TaxID=930804 RepID=A0A2S7KTL7_9FLAO|nr:histidine--tRNA ligase [Aureitalea marina]PQB05979.1 histidine--tRNA ligase [Aureitalea marina]
MKPSIPKGTRDFSPSEMARRNYMQGVIESAFQRFGFKPIATPAMENSQTLMGKYGEEGDRLIFKVLNSGDFLSKADSEQLAQRDSKAVAGSISDKALKYDLTVPFARYVVQHQNEITLPFKRYQIQPVWRADRPQKGRFREFVQCDADVVGSDSLWQEVELIQLYDEVFTNLGLEGTTIKLNNRKILSGLAEMIGAEDKLIPFTVALDKLDKIGQDKVIEEMRGQGIADGAINKLQPLFDLSGSAVDKLGSLEGLLADSEIGQEGIGELRFLITTITQLGLRTANLEIELTLARGLNYYTGAIMEVAAPDSVKMGSIGGGGRYDDLTGIFGLKGVSGVGISFGLDRIYLVLEELELFPEQLSESVRVLFINFGPDEALYATKAIAKIRQGGLSCELYPDAAKMKKQMGYANKMNIPYVVMAGSTEIDSSTFTLKDMRTGDQKQLDLTQLIDAVSNVR